MRALRLLLVLLGVAVAYFLSQLVEGLMFARLAGPGGSIDMLQEGAETGVLASFLVPLALFCLIVWAAVRLVYRGMPVDRVLVAAGGYLGAVLTVPLLAALWGGVLWITTAPWSGPGPRSISLAASMLYFGWIMLYFGGFIALFSLPLAIPALIYAEVRRIHSTWFYCLAGAVIAAAGYLLYLGWISTPRSPWDAVRLALLIASAGALSGLVYWRLAGRTAGSKSQIVASA